MASVNKVLLIGNLGRDPEVRYAPSGAAVCNIAIATSRNWKDKASGEKREETEWHRIVFYDRLAEIAGEFLKKGSSVYIEGRLKTRKWTDKETGTDKYSTEIIAEEMKMLGGRPESAGGDSGSERPRNSNPENRPTAGGAGARAAGDTAKTSADDPFGPMDDDIPF